MHQGADLTPESRLFLVTPRCSGAESGLLSSSG
jgi:hypothetical protein